MSLKGLTSFIVHFTDLLKGFYEKQRESNKIAYYKSRTYFRSSSLAMRKTFVEPFNKSLKDNHLINTNQGSFSTKIKSKHFVFENSPQIQNNNNTDKSDQPTITEDPSGDTKSNLNLKECVDLSEIKEYDFPKSPEYKVNKNLSLCHSQKFQISNSDHLKNIKDIISEHSTPKTIFQSQNLKQTEILNKHKISLKKDLDLNSTEESFINRPKYISNTHEELRKTNFEADQSIPISSSLSKQLTKKLTNKTELENAITLFNSNPKQKNLTISTVNTIHHPNNDTCLKNLTKFLYKSNKIQKKKLGEFFGYEGKEYNKTFLYFLDNFDFSSNHIDECIRKVLFKIRLPRESQQINRILLGISQKYYGYVEKHEIKTKLYSSVVLMLTEELIYQISYSLMMVQTCLHNKQVDQKIDKQSFVSSLKYVQNYDTLKKSGYLEYLYDSVKDEPLISNSSNIQTSGKRSEELLNEVLKELNKINMNSPEKKLIQINSQSDEINVINKIFDNHFSMKFFNMLLISYQRENNTNVLE